TAHARKHVLAALGYRMQLAQNVYGLGRQRNDVRSTGLAGNEAPLSGIQIDIRPASLPEFSWADKNQWSQPQCGPRYLRSAIAVQRTQQLADLFRLGHAG